MEKRTALKPPDNIEIVDKSWDGDKMVARLPNDSGEETYSKAFMYKNTAMDTDTKQAYKLPYRMVDSDGNLGPANQTAVETIISVLNGAMGGVDIPESDRDTIYNYCSNLLEKAGLDEEDIPDLKDENSDNEEIERRTFFEHGDVEVRQEDGEHYVQGHAAVFDEKARIWPDMDEVVRKGTFKRTINNGTDVVALYNHDKNFPLGRRSSGTLVELREDTQGLYYKARLNTEITYHKNLINSIDRGDIIGNSFGFKVVEENINRNEDGPDLRELLEVKLIDVGPVTFPAYGSTDVQARSNAFQEARAKTGIAVDKLAKILTRSYNDRPLSDADRKKLREINQQIDQFVSDDSSQGRHSSDLRKRKLRAKHEFQKLTMEI